MASCQRSQGTWRLPPTWWDANRKIPWQALVLGYMFHSYSNMGPSIIIGKFWTSEHKINRIPIQRRTWSLLVIIGWRNYWSMISIAKVSKCFILYLTFVLSYRRQVYERKILYSHQAEGLASQEEGGEHAVTKTPAIISVSNELPWFENIGLRWCE